MDNEKFGKFIKELRLKNKMTQKELGEKLHITDKAISKWERGISIPDISVLNDIAEFFHVSVSELINGEYGRADIDVEKAVEEAIKNVTLEKEEHKKRIKLIKNGVKITFTILFIISFIIQSVYLFVMKIKGYEYIVDSIFYFLNEILIISIFMMLIDCFKKKNITKIIICIIFIVLTIINIIFMYNNTFNTKYKISFSRDFSNQIVLKQNKDTGEVTYYRDFKFILFTKAKESFSNEAIGEIKMKWLTNDICSITYKNNNEMLEEFVATFGDRGNGKSYYYVYNSLLGEWQVFTQYGVPTKLIANSKGITIIKDKETDFFEYSECKQFGTIALVLYKNQVPKYVIALNEDCKITNTYIEKDGTITLYEISMKKTKPEKLNCITHKSDDMSNYQIVDLDKKDFLIKNDILYVSYDGKKIIEVPGDFSNKITKDYNEYNSQISKEKIIFYYDKNAKRYLVYSDDLGDTWETIEIDSNYSIQVIQFINSKIGFILEFNDVAMGKAYGRIMKTIDGGKTWKEINNGIGEQNVFSRSSKIKFVNENVGFLTMPTAGGEKVDMYITKNGAKTFEKLELIDDEIYDCYNLPTEDNNILYLKITQGSDGDYNGGDYKVFCSEDFGNTWDLR